MAKRKIPRLAVEMPVRHGKSLMVSLAFPDWWLGHYPDDRVILASYAAEYAASWSRQARDTMRTYGPPIFGVEVSDESSAADRWDIKSRAGGMISAGVGGSITGYGADLAIIDDPIKNPEQVDSPTQLEKMDDWYESVLETRLNNVDAPIILMLSRWSKQDLLGRMEDRMGKGLEKWTVLRLPAIAEDKDPLGRKIGEALWPEKWPIEYLQKRQREMKPRWWNALYQQSPIAVGGNTCNPDWWKFWIIKPVYNLVIQAYDTAFKKKKKSDYSVCQTWGACAQGYHLIHHWRDKVTFPGLKRKSIELYNQFNPDMVIIEDAASGQSLLQELEEIRPGPCRDGEVRPRTKIPIDEFTPDRDKISRANAITGLIDAGLVFLPTGAEFNSEIIKEWTDFPNGEHDDIVDTGSMALEYLKKNAPLDVENWETVSGHGLPKDLFPSNEDPWKAAFGYGIR